MTETPEPEPFDWSALENAARAWMRESPQAHEVVRLLVECLQRAMEVAPVASEPPAAPTAPLAAPTRPALPAMEAANLLREALRPRVPAEPTATPKLDGEDVDLAVVAQRARLKAESCRWAIERRKRTKDGAWGPEEIQVGLQALIARGKALPNCYLWMLERGRWLPDDASMEQIAAAFENLGLALEIESSLATGREQPDDVNVDVLALVAECQSALRIALMDLPDPEIDQEQLATFQWLKAITRSRQVYIARHMRLDDPASPKDWYEREQRLMAMQESLAERTKRARETAQAFNKLRYHARRIQAAPLDADGSEDWSRVLETVDRLLASGVKPSSKELRELVIGVVERAPESAANSSGWRLVDEHIDEYLALQEAEQVEPRAARQRTAEVEAAAELLRGCRVVLIGGHERPRSRDALVREFELGELVWITSHEHESLDAFEPDIVHPATTLVILMIRWSSHSYGGVKSICDRRDKLFVRLPGGYSPNQVAAQVLAQVGDRLRARPRCQ